MSIKISELPQASTVNNTDVIPIVQGGTTKKAPAGLIHPTIATTINSTSTNNEVAGAKAVYDGNTFIEIESFDESNATMGGNTSAIGKLDLKILKNISGSKFQIRLDYLRFSSSSNGDCSITVQTSLRPTNEIQNTPIGISWNYQGTDYKLILSMLTISVTTAGILTINAYINDRTPSTNLRGYQMGQYTFTNDVATRSLNLTKTANTGSLVGLGDKAEVTDETLEKTKLDEVTDKDVGELTTEVKEETKEAVTEVKEEIKDEKGSGDNE